ncbi:hypothetical protein C7H09_09435 [Marinobacter fuscus]|uniref:Uncharacterized protein n=1 Tax=Marinobacter fuscus TaxID=2109942 RepID=A0A2T1KDS2_9GAMM|nr:hypothetical protein [Marinobacter fuscus]PSF07692.1 hypothetical protein C7H09_09435 [Marinobacter fuscus]
MKIILALFLTTLLTGCLGPSAEQKVKAEVACEKYVLDNFQKHFGESHIFDTYVKDEKIVVEVGYRDKRSYSDSYSVRVCIYDEAAGTIRIPSLLEMGQWRR